MGRRRSVRLETPLRRSARLRNINPVSEDTEETDNETLAEELSEQIDATENTSIPKSHPESTDGNNATQQLAQMDMTSPGYYTVVLNRLKLDDDDDDGEKEERVKKEDGEREDIRKAGKQAVSRIPTFQSSATRKRTTGSVVEPLVPAPSRVESSNLPVQSRGKGSGSGNSSRVKGQGARETALPLPLARLPISSTDALPHTGTVALDAPHPSYERSHSPSHVPSGTAEPQQLSSIFISPRPALRTEPAPHVQNLMSEAAQEVTIQTDIRTERLTPPEHEQLEEEETWLKAQEKTETDSSFRPLLEEQIVSEGQGLKSKVSDKVESGEEMIQPVDEMKEMGEINKDSAFEYDVKEEEATTRINGAESKSFGLKNGEKETEELLDEFSLKKTGFSSTLVADGGDVGVKSVSDEVACEKRSRRRQVLKSELGKTTVPSDQPANRSLAKSPPSAKSCWRCCPFFMLLSMLLLLGGGGLHLWRYGTPASVSDLLEQLELESLEALWGTPAPCTSDCSFALVESLPEGLEYPAGSPILPPISQAWTQLLSQANDTVSIAAFYFTLRASDMNLTERALQGEQVFDQLMKLNSREVKLQIAVNGPESFPQDTNELNATGAEVRRVNLQSLTGGIIHTKLWVVDNKHVYVGSANMDWRSLTQVKEVGVSVENCSCLAQDMSRVFGVYWYVGSQETASLPRYWPTRYSALSSSERPLHVKLNNVPARVYLSSAPPQLSAQGRTNDLSAILSVISDAQKFIFISVMDYLPFSEFIKPPRFWPAIDVALRAAACARGVEVNLLVSCWPHSPGSMFIFLQSLLTLNRHPLSCSIQVKVFEVTSTEEQRQIPFARVNHAKYMVTDRVAYIGTSNWSENYFTQTAGVGLVVNQTGIEVREGQHTVQSQLKKIFQRDWESEYAHHLSHEHVERCGKHNPR